MEVCRFTKSKIILMFGVAIVLLCISDHVFALNGEGAKTMKVGIEKAEQVLTGPFMRIIVVVGSIWGVIRSYMANSVVLLAGSIGTGLGGNFIISWAKDTWTLLI